MHYTKLAALAGFACVALAHPGPHHGISKREVARRHDLSNRCSQHVARFNEKRWNLNKRSHDHNTTVQIQTEAPYYDVIQNDTCVLTPEATEGPYVWPRSQTLRQDMTEGQPGVPLWLDVGVLDMNTCEPLEGVLVDFWHCNATGSYSSFTGLSPNTAFPTLLNELNVTEFDIGTTDLHTDDTTWLRGMWPTDRNGMMEMKTIFPGFYTERAIHIHVQVHTDWTIRGNGTMAYGNTVSTGQIYFDEDLEEKIMALEPYASHTEINRTTNVQDTVYGDDTDNGYNPVISVVPIDGNDLSKGMVGYITVGVDPTAIETDL
ncbi:Intradiol ring-cleavage dioxygenase core [Penicillium verhagenii]|nr:Intradiol ring-cleavage dioxygenase core [Penicillium verhagenii]